MRNSYGSPGVRLHLDRIELLGVQSMYPFAIKNGLGHQATLITVTRVVIINYMKRYIHHGETAKPLQVLFCSGSKATTLTVVSISAESCQTFRRAWNE